MNRWKISPFYRTSSPIGAAAQKDKKFSISVDVGVGVGVEVGINFDKKQGRHQARAGRYTILPSNYNYD